MSNKLILVFFFMINIFYLIGCTSSNDTKEYQYSSYLIDSTIKNNGGKIYARLKYLNLISFKEYNILTFSFENKKGDKFNNILFVVISDKINKDNIDFTKYDSLLESKEYFLYLTKENTPLKVEYMIRGQEFNKYYLDRKANLLFYDNGYIVADIYKSSNIKGTFISKNN